MPGKSPTVEVSPALIRWARESVGATIDEVAAKLKTPAATILKWEAGEQPPTLRSLEALALFCKRPVAAFFLPAPPPEPCLPHDFRSVPGKQAVPLSRKTRIVIRRAIRLQRLASELLQETGADASPLTQYSTSSNTEDAARAERERLGVTLDQQTGWRNCREAFRAWRSAVERFNIFVFRFPMPPAETRGFSLAAGEPYVIVVSSSDAMPAQIFTLFHEYAHLLLRHGGICLPEEETRTQVLSVESFCNRFAGDFLVPRESLLQHLHACGCPEPAGLTDSEVKAAAWRFKVSKYVLWRRLAETVSIPDHLYWDRVKRWLAEPAPQRKGGKALSPARRSLRQRGRKFSSLVFEAQSRRLITFRDALDYLGVRPQDTSEAEALLRGIASGD
ncbi:MAG: ImmA/IrrE family metallo-endopeptidase [Planctomycetes bacterium]|nr:ImmA/IrrE family metallo-endopeptidase [Planctomycetota bacterium]